MAQISVIVPVYNTEPYIHRCVNSILAQTFTDFELILVDDASPDNCGVICDEYAEKDARVHVIHQDNAGLSAARNAGIDWAFANSNSEWISFIDSDDWVADNYLQALYWGVIDSKLPISSCGFIKIKESIEIDDTEIQYQIINTEDYYTQNRTNCIIACAKLYKKDCFRNIRYPVGKIHEDEFITYQILFSVPQVSVIDATLYYYYINFNGIMHTKWSKDRLAAYDAQLEQMTYFDKNGFHKAYKRTLIEAVKNLGNNYLQCGNDFYKQDIIKKIRGLIKENKRYFSLLADSVPWVCELAYPKYMKLYWLGKSQINRINER